MHTTPHHMTQATALSQRCHSCKTRRSNRMDDGGRQQTLLERQRRLEPTLRFAASPPNASAPRQTGLGCPRIRRFVHRVPGAATHSESSHAGKQTGPDACLCSLTSSALMQRNSMLPSPFRRNSSKGRIAQPSHGGAGSPGKSSGDRCAKGQPSFRNSSEASIATRALRQLLRQRDVGRSSAAVRLRGPSRKRRPPGISRYRDTPAQEW